MLCWWKKSQGRSVNARQGLSVLSQKQFEALTTDEMEALLQNIFIVRDEDAPVNLSVPSAPLMSISHCSCPGNRLCHPLRRHLCMLPFSLGPSRVL